MEKAASGAAIEQSERPANNEVTLLTGKGSKGKEGEEDCLKRVCESESQM